jgi:hypothetical protein
VLTESKRRSGCWVRHATRDSSAAAGRRREQGGEAGGGGRAGHEAKREAKRARERVQRKGDRTRPRNKTSKSTAECAHEPDLSSKLFEPSKRVGIGALKALLNREYGPTERATPPTKNGAVPPALPLFLLQKRETFWTACQSVLTQSIRRERDVRPSGGGVRPHSAD